MLTLALNEMKMFSFASSFWLIVVMRHSALVKWSKPLFPRGVAQLVCKWLPCFPILCVQNYTGISFSLSIILQLSHPQCTIVQFVWLTCKPTHTHTHTPSVISTCLWKHLDRYVASLQWSGIDTTAHCQVTKQEQSCTTIRTAQSATYG